MSLRSEVARILNELLWTGKKISELPNADLPLTGNEYVEIIQGGVNKKVQVSQLPGGGSSDDTDINGIKLHSWDMSTEAFPSGATFGYRGYGTGGPTVTLVDRFGDPIPDGTFIECIKVSGTASTIDPLDWALYTTIIPA